MIDLRKVVTSYLRDSANKIDSGECGLEESEIIYLAQSILHIKVNKSQAANFLGISTRTLDRRIMSGEIPQGKKDLGSNSLYWFKDELLK